MKTDAMEAGLREDQESRDSGGIGEPILRQGGGVLSEEDRLLSPSALRDHPGPDPGPGERVSGSLPTLRPGPSVERRSLATLRNRVLLVDDEPDFLDAVAELLEGNGYDVAKCPSFQEARSLLSSDCFDLVMSECRLSQGDGIELLEEARRLQPRARLFLHSSLIPSDLASRLGPLGIEWIWIKFLDLKVFLDRLRSSPLVQDSGDFPRAGSPAPTPAPGKIGPGLTDASRETPTKPFRWRIS
ncbi:MAG TPA: response regulator [Planctomycetota bacterium]|nr:response regulator [Planctomycetota bacterium]